MEKMSIMSILTVYNGQLSGLFRVSSIHTNIITTTSDDQYSWSPQEAYAGMLTYQTEQEWWVGFSYGYSSQQLWLQHLIKTRKSWVSQRNLNHQRKVKIISCTSAAVSFSQLKWDFMNILALSMNINRVYLAWFSNVFMDAYCSDLSSGILVFWDKDLFDCLSCLPAWYFNWFYKQSYPHDVVKHDLHRLWSLHEILSMNRWVKNVIRNEIGGYKTSSHILHHCWLNCYFSFHMWEQKVTSQWGDAYAQVECNVDHSRELAYTSIENACEICIWWNDIWVELNCFEGEIHGTDPK